jgi:hypothetical protein
MKPSDFFITSRQLFGLLIPGTVWVSALVLILVKTDVLRLMNYVGEANLAGCLGFLLVAFILGTILQYPSFALTAYCAAKWGRFRNWIGSDPNYPDTQAHRKKVRDVIWAKYGNLQKWEALWGVQPPQVLADEQKSQHEVFALCKRSILSRAPAMARRLLDHEDEINLLGMLPLPTTLFAVALLLHVQEVGSLGLRGPHWLWYLGLFLAWGVLIVYLVRRFYYERAEEYRSAYIIFLLIERGLVKDAGGERPASETNE